MMDSGVTASLHKEIQFLDYRCTSGGVDKRSAVKAKYKQAK